MRTDTGKPVCNVLLLNGSQTYDLMYYYKSYKEYEIAEIPDYYECGTESLWDVTYDMIVRSEPTNKNLHRYLGIWMKQN